MTILPDTTEGGSVPVLRSAVDTASEAYLANRATQLAAIAALNEQLELALAGGGAKYAQRHRERGRLLARERVELLVDRDSPPLELSSLAAWGTEFAVGRASSPASAWCPGWSAS
jgi:acetyl-CoA carboxylase carboxyltransferase component